MVLYREDAATEIQRLLRSWKKGETPASQRRHCTHKWRPRASVLCMKERRPLVGCHTNMKVNVSEEAEGNLQRLPAHEVKRGAELCCSRCSVLRRNQCAMTRNHQCEHEAMGYVEKGSDVQGTPMKLELP